MPKVNKRHNITICDNKFNSANNSCNKTSNTHAGAGGVSAIKNIILLETGYANVFNVGTDSYMSIARLLFDSRSQRSYITESLKGFLKFRCVRKERLIIKTFWVNESCM